MIQPLRNNVVIEEIISKKDTQTKSGILLTTKEHEGDCRMGVVKAIGADVLDVGLDEKVVYSYGDRIDVDGEDLFIVQEENILAVITEK